MRADANQPSRPSQPSRSSSWNDRLCGGDPDLKCPEHDVMSFVLGDSAFVLELCQDARAKINLPCMVEPVLVEKIQSPVELEFSLPKGIGEYRTIIGFADAVATGTSRVTYRDRQNEDRAACAKCRHSTGCLRIGCNPPDVIGAVVLIEAKPHLPNPMETLRQLNFYREFPPYPSGNHVHLFLLWCPTIQNSVRNIFEGQNIFVSTLPVPEL